MFKEKRAAVGGASSKSYNFIQTRLAYKRKQKQEQLEQQAKEVVEEAFKQEHLEKVFAPIDKQDLKHMKKQQEKLTKIQQNGEK